MWKTHFLPSFILTGQIHVIKCLFMQLQWKTFSMVLKCFTTFCRQKPVVITVTAMAASQKKHFFALFSLSFLSFSSFYIFHAKTCKNIFRAAFGVHSTQMRVQIFNNWLFWRILVNRVSIRCNNKKCSL